MSNLAENMNFWDEVALEQERHSPKPKASVLKFQRSKHPTGFGEQPTGHRYKDDWWVDEKIARKLAQAPSIEEGLEEHVIASVTDCRDTLHMTQRTIESQAEQDHIDYCHDKAIAMFDEDDSSDYDNEDDIKEVLEDNAPAHAYVAPLPADNKVRVWYTGKGKAARLTQRQYTADCGQALPEGYDPYEG